MNKKIIKKVIGVISILVVSALTFACTRNGEATEKETTKEKIVIMCNEKERQTYKDVIGPLEGDYYKDIESVFEKYINKDQAVPTDNVYDIRDYGATNDMNILSTKAINKAIAAASKTQGTVLITGGNYRSGTIYLRSNVNIHITADSAVYGSRDVSKYSGTLIKGVNTKNVTITGGGKFCGEGEYFVGLPSLELKDKYPKIEADFKEPSLVEIPFVNVMTTRSEVRARIRGLKMDWARPGGILNVTGGENITLENVVFEASPAWTLTFASCSNITIDHVVLNDNRHVANADGIDICGSSNVTITNSFVSAADDGIVLKNDSSTKGAMSNITVKNCEVMSVANCFKIGTETYNDISDVTVEDCHFFLTDIYPGSCSGISLEAADGTKLTNVTIRNIKMENVQCPLFISVNNRNKYGQAKAWQSDIDGVLIENVTAVGVDSASIITGASDIGLTEETKDAASKWVTVKNVTIKNFNVTFRESTQNLSSEMAKENTLDGEPTYDEVSGVKLYPTAQEYPEFNRLGDVPAYGFYLRHVEGITLENISVTKRTVDTREMYYTEGVAEDITIK